MNVEEVAHLLAYAAAVDTRFNTADADQAKAKVAAWLTILADVPADFAAAAMTQAYRRERKYAVQPGEIREAWLVARDRQAVRQVTAAIRRPIPEHVAAELDRLREELAERRRAEGRPALRRGEIRDAGAAW